MALTDSERLRQLLGERIPPGRTAEDTMFSEEEIEEFLARGSVNETNPIEAAAYYGWQSKAAELSNYVNVIEGNSSREMGELHRQALRMVTQYAGFVPAPGRGKAVVGYIRRPGVNS